MYKKNDPSLPSFIFFVFGFGAAGVGEGGLLPNESEKTFSS